MNRLLSAMNLSWRPARHKAAVYSPSTFSDAVKLVPGTGAAGISLVQVFIWQRYRQAVIEPVAELGQV